MVALFFNLFCVVSICFKYLTMESHGEEETDFTSVIEYLVLIYGHIVTREVIETVVESCEGDLNLSMDMIMNITNDDNAVPEADEPSPNNNANTEVPAQQSSLSYATFAAQYQGTIVNTGTMSTTINITKQNQRTKTTHDFWTDQIREIITHHNTGTRIMILMRGAPGSGKSHFAKLLVESMIGSTFNDYVTHILSTDDFFMIRGQYNFDKLKLSFAHSWNQERVRRATEQGLSPIIIDNTNIEIWEMHPYVAEGIKNGYIIEVVEPTTPWAKKANQLFKKNMHNVPLNTIKRMLENFSEGVTGASLKQSFGLSYPSNMKPPVRRLVPPFSNSQEDLSSPKAVATVAAKVTVSCNEIIRSSERSVEIIQAQQSNDSITDYSVQQKEEESVNENLSPSELKEYEPESNTEVDELTQEDQAVKNKYLEAQKKIDEMEKFSEEWENGETWDQSDQVAAAAVSNKPSDELTTNTAIHEQTATSSITNTDTVPIAENTTSLITNLESKPPRKERNDILNSDSKSQHGLLQSVNDCKDWRDMWAYMPSWDTPDEKRNIAPTKQIAVETTTSSTCVEIGDKDLSGVFKIMSTASRDINEFYIPPEREKIPEKRMLDKSTMTNEEIMMLDCPQKEKHFIAFTRMYKHIPRDSLRDIFDNCCGDVNWAVENVLGEEGKYEKTTDSLDDSDKEDEINDADELPCTCLGKYDIIPIALKSNAVEQAPKVEETQATGGEAVPQLERKKKDSKISEETMQLKRQIEQNVVISDSHYSEHCLKIRKMRRGENYKADDVSEQPSTSEPEKPPVLDTTNNTENYIDSSDDEDGTSSDISDNNKIVSINLGKTFINDLDNMFGRENMEYPENISYNISVPTTLLNEINALWMESLMFQLDESTRKSAAMVKQDEEFARQLAMKEQELLLEGKEPVVPDFKEIMDLEFAISLHIKDMSEWKNNIPNDLAAKLTHDKLFNLFPEIEHDTLLEMLVAHDNNFKLTVEVLLTSMGKSDVVEAENGVNKFVMAKELERQEKVLEEQRKTLSAWPPFPKGEKVCLSTVQAYRDEAEEHLKRRNAHMQKAEEYIRRGMTQVANYYSEIAAFHKSKHDQANSMAVATLMQYHANNSPDGETVDLHFFRVKEAKETMDIFIDFHIQKLRETNKRNTVLFFITGRGLHSSGLPRIKPACVYRLRQRGLRHSECNPGLIRARVSCDDKLMCEIP